MIKTRFVKAIAIIATIALGALFYVHQEVETVKTSFHINKNRQNLSFLLDQRRSLVYNLSRLQSPERVEEMLSVNEIVLCMPKIENIRRSEGMILAYSEKEEIKREESFLTKILDRFSTEAEAKVVK